eukprot:2653378-Pleurochrysis_carterae.AAC.1
MKQRASFASGWLDAPSMRRLPNVSAERCASGGTNVFPPTGRGECNLLLSRACSKLKGVSADLLPLL